MTNFAVFFPRHWRCLSEGVQCATYIYFLHFFYSSIHSHTLPFCTYIRSKRLTYQSFCPRWWRRCMCKLHVDTERTDLLNHKNGFSKSSFANSALIQFCTLLCVVGVGTPLLLIDFYACWLINQLVQQSTISITISIPLKTGFWKKNLKCVLDKILVLYKGSMPK